MGVLEALLPGNWDSTNQDRTIRNFQRLNALFGLVTKNPDGFGFTIAGISVRFGAGTAVFTASVTSAPVVVNHGLGRAPIVAAGITRSSLIGYAVTATSSTTITVTGFVTMNTAGSASLPFYWIAVG